MKKTLAIILSILMLFSVSPIGVFASEATYDRAAVANGEGIDELTHEQMAAVILDWVDRRIAEVTADFESFEVEVMGQTIAVDIPEIKGVDDLVAYADYLAKLEGDFAKLDVTNLKTLSRANGNLEFVYGVIQFVADNADIFGKVFHWEEGKVFDYGKVGEYILALDTTDENNKKIVDFYNDYLIGNDIQEKFVAGIAKEMGYEIPVDENGERAETFDETISNGIVAWFAGLCEENGILSDAGIAALKNYDLRTTDIYTLVKNFVGLVQSDNQDKIDTYYNYILDTVVRTLLKSVLGFTAKVGEEVTDEAVVNAFTAVYKDLALLEEVSGGPAYFKNGDAYYQVTVAGGAVKAVNALTWEQALDINFEPPVVGIYTGENAGTLVKEYKPTSKEYKQLIYSTYAEQIAAEGFEVAGTTVADEYAALMVDENKAPAMSECFGVKVTQGAEEISNVVISFADIETYVNGIALEKANEAAAKMVDGTTITAAEVSAIDVVMAYEGWATEDEFIVQVTATATAKVKVTAYGFTMEQDLDASSYITNPVAVIVLDDLSGNLNIDDAKALLEFLDTDFDIDADLLDIAGNYDAFDGAVGQVNHILYGLVDMLVSDSAMATLDLKDGDNNNLTANLQKICDTANDMMAAAEKVMNDEGLQAVIEEMGMSDALAQLNGMKADLLYAIDFSSVEGLYVSAISMALDILDDGTNATVTELHAALEGLKTLDAMAVAATDYLLGKCIPEANTALADLGFALTVPAKTTAEVADGEAKDIIMTKLVDVAFEATTWAVDVFLNDTANDILANIFGEPRVGLPEIKFAFGVEKGATWSDTLAAMVNRVYELAGGIIIACDNDYTDTFDKISAVANAILPLGSLASNCASDNFAFDVDLVLNDYIFADGLNGELDGFLGLFETATKTADVAANVPVTKALINASEHIVDAIFPDTINAGDYEETVTVQEEFTSGDNDVVIASNNMKSINARKADLVPAVLDLIREAGAIPYFAACDHANGTTEVTGTPATCTKTGVEDSVVCNDCGAVISGGDEIPMLDHDYGDWTTVTEPGCETEGLEKRACECGAFEENVLPATGHTDENADEICDTCGADLHVEEELTFFEKIINFFRQIIDWIMSLFA